MNNETFSAARGAVPSNAAAALYSEPSERALLSCALNEQRRPILHRLLGLLSNDDFFIEQHAALWSCIQTLNNNSQPHDPMAVLDYSARRQVFVGGAEYLAALMEDPLAVVASDEAVETAAQRVKDYATLRRLSAALDQGKLLCASGRPVQDVIGVVEDDLRNLRKLSETSRSGPKHVKTAIGKVLEQMQMQMDGELQPAVPTGYDDLDQMIYGLSDGDLIVLAARPSIGKTAMLLNICRNIALNREQPRKVLIFSTEMVDVALARRLMAREGRVNLASIRRGNLTSEEISRLSEGIGVLEHADIYIDDEPGLGLPELRARARAFVAEHGKCVIGVDYLQNMEAGEGVDRKDHVAAMSRGLKQLARELGVPLIALSQLARTLEQRQNKRPIMSDLRESGQVEQDADVIMFLYRDEVYNPDTKEPGICEVIVAKQRDGAVGTAKTGFDKTTGAFHSLHH